jgi:LmbE family N-acetylglucosaminyl deacetylase
VNVLAIGAHPDDIEYGCGGTLTLYAQKGHAVYLFVATSGSRGGRPATRQREQEHSKVVIGARRVFWGGYSDTELPYDRKLIVQLESVIKRVRPHMIFVNHPDDTHQDHRNLARAAISATRYVPNFVFYEVPSTQGFTPNCYANVEKVLDRKLACLEAHHSQVTKTNIEDMTILELATSCANFRGIQARVKYAEAFQSVRLLLDI